MGVCMCVCMYVGMYICMYVCTVDREYFFVLKIIRVKNFRVVNFLQFCSIRENFLTVDGCNMDERL